MKILKYTYDNQKYEIFCCNLSLSHFLALANAIASPIGSQSPGNSFILKLKYCSRLSLYISLLRRTA